MFCGNCGTEQMTPMKFCTTCGFPQTEQLASKNAGSSATNMSSNPMANYLESNAPRPMGFTESIIYCLQNWDNFEGRASRSEFWNYWMFNMLAVFVLTAISIYGISTDDAWLAFLFLAFLVFSIMPVAAASTRRLHDIGRTGANWFWGLIPYVGPVLLIVWYTTPGESEANNFGPPS